MAEKLTILSINKGKSGKYRIKLTPKKVEVGKQRYLHCYITDSITEEMVIGGEYTFAKDKFKTIKRIFTIPEGDYAGEKIYIKHVVPINSNEEDLKADILKYLGKDK